MTNCCILPLCEWHFTCFFGAGICFRTNCLFFVCVCAKTLVLLLFPKKMGFCQSKKISENQQQLFRTREICFSVDLTLLLNNTLFGCLSPSLALSLARSLSLWIDADEPFTIRSEEQEKKGTHTQKKRQTRWNIWQSYATKHRSIHAHTCCVSYMYRLLRTSILTDRVKSKEDFNLNVCVLLPKSKFMSNTHTHTQEGGRRKTSNNEN